MAGIADKVRKLLELSKSSNEAEATLAAQKASELILKYKLEEGDYVTSELKGGISHDYIPMRYENKWQLNLCYACAHSCSVYAVHLQDKKVGDKMCLIGLPHEVAAVRSIYEWLMPQVLFFAGQAIEKKQIKQTTKDMEAFFSGCVIRIGQRLMEQTKETIASYGAKGTELVRVSKEANKEYAANQLGFTNIVSMRKITVKETPAFWVGHKAGDGATLGNEKAMTSGHKALKG